MTTETKHTAGPWMVTGSNGDGTSITNERGASIARWPAGHELMFNDAKLLASAPDLLAALEHCLLEHGGYTIKGETERKARAAIRKARGEA